MSEWSLCYLKQNMSDCERNVRVSFKLSREAAIKLREIALAKSDLLCDLGVLAVQLGKESQICISSALTFENVNHSVSRAKKTRGKGSLVRSSVPKRKVTILERSVDKRRFSNVDRGVQRVDEALARAAVASVAVSDARPTLPSMGALNKATFMSKTSTHDAEDRSHEPRANSDHVTNAVNKPRNSCASFVENNTAERCVPMKSISSDGTIKFNAKDAENVNRGAVLGAVHANHPSKKKPFIVKQDCKNPKDDNVSVGKELPDDLGVSSSSDDNLKHATDMAACQESSRGKSSPQDNQVIQATVGDSKVSHNEKNIDVKYDKGDVAISSAASLENNGDDADTNMSSMSESFDCNDMPTFPRHGISFAQHLINLSKQYRLDNEKSPNGLANERFFEPSRFVRNDHVLRSFTTGNEKQEDFMGLSGQNALLFDGNYSATAVKTAEELSKEQSEASPTNLDSLSEASADSLFEEARLGSVDELSLSPSSTENVPISSENNSSGTSTAMTGKRQAGVRHLQAKQEKYQRKMKYQKHLKGHSGIICKLCMHPVSKSYSCYKLAHAPKEIRHLFEDGSHCVRVCRRCLPYKSPKRSEKNTQKKLHKTLENLLK